MSNGKDGHVSFLGFGEPVDLPDVLNAPTSNAKIPRKVNWPNMKKDVVMDLLTRAALLRRLSPT